MAVCGEISMAIDSRRPESHSRSSQQSDSADFRVMKRLMFTWLSVT
jgi:hypothetical protein